MRKPCKILETNFFKHKYSKLILLVLNTSKYDYVCLFEGPSPNPWKWGFDTSFQPYLVMTTINAIYSCKSNIDFVRLGSTAQQDLDSTVYQQKKEI